MKRLLLLLLPVLLLSGGALPGGLEEETAEQTGVYEVENGLDEEERTISGELRIDGSYDAAGALSRLWSWCREKMTEALRQELSFAGKLLGLALLCGLAVVLCPEGSIPEYAELSACCAASLLLAGSLEGVIRRAADTLDRLTDYANAAVPAFFSTVAASGAAVSASVKYAAVCLAMDVFMNLSQRLILPLIRGYLAVGIAGSLFENPLLKGAQKLTKWCAVTAMTLMTTVFTLYITLSGVISGSADAVAVKSTKTVIAAALPVVGGILSDSASAVVAAAGLIRSSAGVFCLVAVCVLCGGAFALLSVKMLVFKATAIASELVCSGRFPRLLSQVGSAFGMLLGLVGSYGLMLFLSFMSGIRMVSA